MTPFVILFTLLKPVAFAAHAAAIGLIAFLLLGSYGPLALTLTVFFLVPSIVMGFMYKKGMSARSVVLATFGVLLAQMLLELVLFSIQFPIQWSAQLSSMLRVSLRDFENSGLLPAGGAAEMADALAQAMVTMLPMLLLFWCFLFAVISHALSRRALRSSGVKVPALPPLRTWRLPRSLVFYYLAAMILTYAVPREGSGFWTIVSANLMPLLMIAFTIQAVGLFFFLADAKSWPKAVPFLIAVPLILFQLPILLFAMPRVMFPPFYLIGLLDVAVPLRRYFVK
jgi:uncharacterized protein YybS (DUF2232 family)